jgi:glyoxylase-like metal-dependent hydrolase (beta-lactamase superfamily II)
MKRILASTLALGVAGALVSQIDAATPHLDIDVYNPGTAGVFPVTSTIVSGRREAVLIDAQFTRRDAAALVERLKAKGKTLTTIYISHSDPDYYFGLETIQKAFPKAKIVATPQTVAAIEANKQVKLAYWGPVLKDQAPSRVIVPEPVRADTLNVDGQPLKIMGLDGDTPDRSYLWVPHNRTVLGGVPVLSNMHVWMADTQTPSSRVSWMKTLADIEALKPDMVVPGHFLPNADGSQPLTLHAVAFTRDYLAAFENAAAKAANSTELVAAMKARYPTLPGVESLELSAKVIKGELTWPEAQPAGRYPFVGKKVQVNFGDLVFDLDFKDEKTMSFLGIAGAFKGATDTVQYTAVAIRPNVFMIYWHEPKGGANVVHLQDLEKGVVHTNIAQPNGDFFNLTGQIKLVDADN